MSSLTPSIAAFVAATHRVNDAAMRIATSGFIDCFGVMLAGRHEAVVRSTTAVALDGSPTGRSSVLLSGRTTRAADAALVNATAAHALAMDDVAAGCHPSAVLATALLAEGEAIGASGAALLTAYVVGYEVLVTLARREPDALHATGWHPTGLLGPVAVAAAVANLHRFDAPRSAHAIGIAASASGGLQANFGTQTKALHLGRAASAGLVAARLAAEGVTAAVDALEHPKGLLRAVSPRGRVDVATPFSYDAEQPLIETIGLGIKKYPVCFTTHRIVDAAIDLATAADLAPSSIARVEVRTGRAQAAMARHDRPRTPLEAKYSVPFAVAAGLVARGAGFEQLTMAFIDSPEVRRLVANTTIALVDETGDDDPVFSPSDRVVVHLRDGRVLDSGEVAYARGHARLPLSAEAQRRKFVECVTAGGCEGAEALHDRLSALAGLANVRSLVVDR